MGDIPSNLCKTMMKKINAKEFWTSIYWGYSSAPCSCSSKTVKRKRTRRMSSRKKREEKRTLNSPLWFNRIHVKHTMKKKKRAQESHLFDWLIDWPIKERENERHTMICMNTNNWLTRILVSFVDQLCLDLSSFSVNTTHWRKKKFAPEERVDVSFSLFLFLFFSHPFAFSFFFVSVRVLDERKNVLVLKKRSWWAKSCQ